MIFTEKLIKIFDRLAREKYLMPHALRVTSCLIQILTKPFEKQSKLQGRLLKYYLCSCSCRNTLPEQFINNLLQSGLCSCQAFHRSTLPIKDLIFIINSFVEITFCFWKVLQQSNKQNVCRAVKHSRMPQLRLRLCFIFLSTSAFFQFFQFVFHWKPPPWRKISSDLWCACERGDVICNVNK